MLVLSKINEIKKNDDGVEIVKKWAGGWVDEWVCGRKSFFGIHLSSKNMLKKIVF
jgi:hypothetical protein